MKPLHRRTFLRGLGGAAIALPLLDAMQHRAEAAVTKRIVFFYSYNGTIPQSFFPPAGALPAQLPTILQPLDPHRDRLVVLDHLNNTAGGQGAGDGHQKNSGSLPTAQKVASGSANYAGGSGQSCGWPQGPSIDEEIAKLVSAPGQLGALRLSIWRPGVQITEISSYAGPDAPILAENNPLNAFDAVFGDLDLDPATKDALATRRKWVLDTVQDDYASLRSRLGAADRQKVEAHLTAIEQIEKSLVAPPPPASCTAPDVSAVPTQGQVPMDIAGKAQMDILVRALACDLTRVGVVQWSGGVSGKSFKFTTSNGNVIDAAPSYPPAGDGGEAHHDLSHEDTVTGPSSPAQKLTYINRWYASQLAYLIAELQSAGIFDDTIVVWLNNLGQGGSHSGARIPVVVAAGAATGLVTGGRTVDCNGRAHNDLFVTLLNAMGSPVSSFGQANLCTGAISALV